jgi:BlaI family transcriptional regulator, penicillinase repressor
LPQIFFQKVPKILIDITNVFVMLGCHRTNLFVFLLKKLKKAVMPRNPSSQPNDVELSILRVIWNQKACTVREVHEALQPERKTGYTSTLKMMQVMCEKGLLKRDDSQRPQIYRSAIPEEQTQKKIVRDLLQKVFGGSARKLVMQAVQAERISREELAEIRKLLDKMEGGKS